MNILFFLTPKASCTCVYDDYSVRQAMERIEKTSYTSLPIISRDGKYCGTLTEGDLLWALKDRCGRYEGRGGLQHHENCPPLRQCAGFRDHRY